MTKEQLIEIVNASLETYNKLDNLAEPVRRLAANDVAKRMFDIFNTVAKRRPYLFLITTQHNDEYTSNSMVYYLEPNQNPKEFKEESAAHLRSVYGEGAISLRSIKL